jgi:hypothetical protein
VTQLRPPTPSLPDALSVVTHVALATPALAPFIPLYKGLAPAALPPELTAAREGRPDAVSLFWRARRLQALVFQVGGFVCVCVCGGGGGGWGRGQGRLRCCHACMPQAAASWRTVAGSIALRGPAVHAHCTRHRLDPAAQLSLDRPPTQDWARLAPPAAAAIVAWEERLEELERPLFEARTYAEALEVGGQAEADRALAAFTNWVAQQAGKLLDGLAADAAAQLGLPGVPHDQRLLDMLEAAAEAYAFEPTSDGDNSSSGGGAAAVALVHGGAAGQPTSTA